MKLTRVAIVLYILFDLLIGGHNGGLFPLSLVESASAQVAPNYSANSSPGSNISFVAGRFVANNYGTYAGSIATGNAASGSASITVRGGYINLPDGRNIVPFAVGVPIVINDAAPELITPTAVSGCYKSQGMNQGDILVSCTITASFATTHGVGATITSATNGAAEAALDAFNWGGGTVTLAPGWKLGLNTSCTGCFANQTAALQAILPFANVGIEDAQSWPVVPWSITPNATVFAAPSALAAGTVASSATVAGSASFTGGTIHVRYSCVDVMGNEGPPSADYSFADTSAKAIVFQAPPAATGCVGYIPYIGLESGSAGAEYQVLLYTQPGTIGNQPVGNGVCTLTTIETVTPACAITNATYGQTGAIATVATYPLVTSPIAVGTGGLSTASVFVGNSNARTVYKYQPGGSVGTAGVAKNSFLFTTATAAGSAIVQGLGTLTVPSGFMNYVGRTIRVCGEAYSSTQGASTIVAINFYWDAQGSDVTTGLPVLLGGPLVLNTLTTGTVASFSFCQDLTTTVASASATGGSILAGKGELIESALTTGATPAAGPSNQNSAAVGSLNLAGPARIGIFMKQTTSTTAVPQLFNLTVQVLN